MWTTGQILLRDFLSDARLSLLSKLQDEIYQEFYEASRKILGSFETCEKTLDLEAKSLRGHGWLRDYHIYPPKSEGHNMGGELLW